MVKIDGIEYRRFPENGSAPIDDCFALCEEAGYSVLSMDSIAQLRVRHNKNDDPAWTQVQGAYSGSVVGVGLLEGGLPTIVVAHRNHPLMTASAIRRFMSERQRFDRGGIRLSKDEVQGLILPHNDSQRDIFVYQGPQLTHPQVLNNGMVSATIDGTARTLLVPMIGNKDFVEPYLQGHRNNFSAEIGIFFDQVALKSEGLLFRPLWFGVNFNISLYGNNEFNDYGCVFGVPFSAADTTQKISPPEKNSFLAELLSKRV
jgi:hypothetical protein